MRNEDRWTGDRRESCSPDVRPELVAVENVHLSPAKARKDRTPWARIDPPGALQTDEFDIGRAQLLEGGLVFRARFPTRHAEGPLVPVGIEPQRDLAG